MHTPDHGRPEDNAQPNASVPTVPDYERTDLSIKGVLVFFLCTTLALGGIQFGLRDMLAAYHPDPHSRTGARPISEITPPEPRLQSQPMVDYTHHIEQQTARLQSFSWIDRRKKIVHIPIERALDIISERGLPEITEGKATNDSSK